MARNSLNLICTRLRTKTLLSVTSFYLVSSDYPCVGLQSATFVSNIFTKHQSHQSTDYRLYEQFDCSTLSHQSISIRLNDGICGFLTSFSSAGACTAECKERTNRTENLLQQKCACNTFSVRRERALITLISCFAQIHYHFPLVTVPLYVFSDVFSWSNELVSLTAVSIALRSCAFVGHISYHVICNHHIVYGDGFGYLIGG